MPSYGWEVPWLNVVIITRAGSSPASRLIQLGPLLFPSASDSFIYLHIKLMCSEWSCHSTLMVRGPPSIVMHIECLEKHYVCKCWCYTSHIIQLTAQNKQRNKKLVLGYSYSSSPVNFMLNAWMKKRFGFPTSEWHLSPLKTRVRSLSSTGPSVPYSAPLISMTQQDTYKGGWLAEVLNGDRQGSDLGVNDGCQNSSTSGLSCPLWCSNHWKQNTPIHFIHINPCAS